MRTFLSLGAVLVVIGCVGAAIAGEGPRIELQILDRSVAATGVHVAVFMSCDKQEGVTDADGRLTLDAACGAQHYWVEIDGRRVNELYRHTPGVKVIDLRAVTFQPERGGR